MILDDFQKGVILSALAYYIKHPDIYSVTHTIIDEDGAFSFPGFNSEDANDIYQNLKLGRSDIDDVYVENILNVILAYKDDINESIRTGGSCEMKSVRKDLNTVIRALKAYADQNGISLLDPAEADELPDIPVPPFA